MKNGRVLAVLVYIGLIAAGFAGSAQALSVPVNDYTLNFSAASGALGGPTIPNLQHVDEMQFLASSILGFRDIDRSGGISTGDRFQDYLMLRFHTINNSSGSSITPLTYGTGPGRTHEMTVKAAFSGVQISDNQYIITAVQLADSTLTPVPTLPDRTSRTCVPSRTACWPRLVVDQQLQAVALTEARPRLMGPST